MSMCMNMLHNIITLKPKAKSEYCSELNTVLRISRIRLISQKDLNLVVHMQHDPGGRTAIYFYDTFMWNLFTFILLKLSPPFQFGIWQKDFFFHEPIVSYYVFQEIAEVRSEFCFVL